MAPRTGSRSRRRFGATWWGRAWTEALEQRARLDPNRLPRGRTYARHSRVGALTAEPGEVRASVLGSRASAYRVRVRVRPFTEDEWATALAAIAARAGHAAALLDGELPPEVVDDLAAAGIDLLPVAGEVGTTCSCPDWANPCKHAAAVCYLVADLLDDDPFVVLQLRGRHRDQVMGGLRALRSAPTGEERSSGIGAGAEDPGISAREAWAPGERPAPPRPPLPPEHPGRPAPLAIDPPAEAGVSAAALTALAADAAERAWALATGVAGDDDGAGLGLSEEADLARRAAAALGTPGFDLMAGTAGRSAAELARLAIAWRWGGAGGVAVLEDRWSPGAEVMADARAQLAETTGNGRPLRMNGNRMTLAAGRQLRYGRDGRWYPLERRRGRWELTGPPDPDPVTAAPLE